MVTRSYDAFMKVQGIDFTPCKVNVEMPKAIGSSTGTPPTRFTKSLMMKPNPKAATICRTLVHVVLLTLSLCID